MANGFGSLSLTTDGLNLLAKAQTGTQLKFTRIAVGDGILNGQNPVTLKHLMNEVMSLNISTLIVNGTGAATVGAILSNSDLTNGFYWREIGIFAQDPQLGEILYGYANANDGEIYIPDKGTSVFTAPCNIGLYVLNAQNVTAVIDSSLVFATKQDVLDLQNVLTTHENNAAVHITRLTCTTSETNHALTGLSATSGKVLCIFTADAAFTAGDTFSVTGTAYTLQTTDGTIIGTGAFVSGAEVKIVVDVDNKKIYITPSAPVGTITGATFGDMAVPRSGQKLQIPMPTAAQVGAINPNLLINGDFQVWQRGTSFSNVQESVYNADRWRSLNDGNTTCSKSDNGITITSTVNAYNNIVQSIEFNKNLLGRICTLTAKINVKSLSGTGVIPTGETVSKPVVGLIWGSDITNWNDPNDPAYIDRSATAVGTYLLSETIILPSSGVTSSFDFGVQFHNCYGEAEVEWIKLELSSAPTPFVPRPYAEELALCQRYYIPAANGLMTDQATDQIGFLINTPTTMRINPTIESFSLWSNTSRDKIDTTGFSLYSIRAAQNGLQIYIQKANHGITVPCHLNILKIDAEIYG